MLHQNAIFSNISINILQIKLMVWQIQFHRLRHSWCRNYCCCWLCHHQQCRNKKCISNKKKVLFVLRIFSNSRILLTSRNANLLFYSFHTWIRTFPSCLSPAQIPHIFHFTFIFHLWHLYSFRRNINNLYSHLFQAYPNGNSNLIQRLRASSLFHLANWMRARLFKCQSSSIA